MQVLGGILGRDPDRGRQVRHSARAAQYLDPENPRLIIREAWRVELGDGEDCVIELHWWQDPVRAGVRPPSVCFLLPWEPAADRAFARAVPC